MNDGGPAFPTMDARELDQCPVLISPGMSLRDYFAAKAMQAIVSNPALYKSCIDVGSEESANGVTVAALLAYKAADAMLEARKK